MTQITLKQIEAAHNDVAQMIEQFKLQTPAQMYIPEATITLQPGEHYGGLVFNEDGKPSHHVILLPEEACDMNWGDAVNWATTVGGTLPNRSEQAILFANLKSQFKAQWYWSDTQCSENSAWCQHFYDGIQSASYESAELFARAVRRLPA